jgi:hypothetical protein
VSRWLPNAAPKQYSAWAKACSGQSQHFIVKAYPKDALAIKWTPDNWAPVRKFLETVQEFFKRFVNDRFSIEIAKGAGVLVEAQWTEYDDWRAFYKFTATIGFNPLISLTFRIPWGLTAFLPAWLKKWIGELEFFIEFGGAIMVGMQFGRDQPGPPRLSGRLEGQVGVKLGFSFKVGPKNRRAVGVTIAGGSAIKGTAAPRYTDAEGPFVELAIGYTGLTVAATITLWNGKWEKEFTLQVLDEKTFKKGNWYLTKNTA